MKRVFVATVLLLTLVTCVLGQRTAAYPNELHGYRFYETARWRSLTLCISTPVDIRKLLGSPDNATDLEHAEASASYPGDANVASVVFTYSRLMSGWDVLIYVRRSCSVSQTPSLCSIELLPHKRISFANVTFPSIFAKRHVNAVDAAWDEYSDGSGLRYEVYTTKPQYGSKLPGDLNRITYGKP